MSKSVQKGIIRSMKEYIEFIPGYRTALMDGTMVPDSPKHMATEEFYKAKPGDRLRLCASEYLFAVAVFDLQREDRYIYSYDYQREQNWTTYTRNLTPDSYRDREWVFVKECFFRVCLRRKDGTDMTPEDHEPAKKAILFEHLSAADEDRGEKRIKDCFLKEADQTIQEIKAVQQPGNTATIGLIADTHYTVNGTWEDTAANLQRVAKEIRFDAIVHLGDFTDGMVSKRTGKKYVSRILDDMRACKAPVYAMLGNHDTNYFRNSANIYSHEELQEVYQLPGETAYYVDMERYRLRLVFLDSFDPLNPLRYGYGDEELEWLKKTLYSAEPGTRFLIFSHIPPLTRLDYWSFYTRNGEKLVALLEDCNAREEYQVIGLIYGHTHADYIYDACSFPMVSVGCAKLEYFTQYKPEGAITRERRADTVTQDLWDSLIIDFDRQELQLIRFGAGENRSVSFVKKVNRRLRIAAEKEKNRKMQIWAHRGASAHAPENTLPAFELALDMGADGIELDVQLSGDGVPVVIHDERIDRTSDGKGFVRDYTLEELKRFNFGKNFPLYGRVSIPTLAEVLELIKNREIVLNIELKNSICFYEGLEEKVLKLAADCGVGDKLLYSSFNHCSLRKLKNLNPEARIAFLYSEILADAADYGARNECTALHPALSSVRYPGMVRECHERGIRVHVWTVNEDADFEEMKNLGVDAVITNFVERGLRV